MADPWLTLLCGQNVEVGKVRLQMKWGGLYSKCGTSERVMPLPCMPRTKRAIAGSWWIAGTFVLQMRLVYKIWKYTFIFWIRFRACAKRQSKTWSDLSVSAPETVQPRHRARACTTV